MRPEVRLALYRFLLLTAPFAVACDRTDNSFSGGAARVGFYPDSQPVTTLVGGSYVVLSRETLLPDGLTASLEAAGCRVTAALNGAGIALVTATDSRFLNRATALAGVRSVFPDRDVPVLAGPLPPPPLLFPYCSPPSGATGEFFRPLQWGLDAIHAPEAWALGARGQGVRVAVLDSGIDVHHPDLSPNVNRALGVSFVPGSSFIAPRACNMPFYDPRHHGTHVAGIIAAALNNYGVVGVAPEAELVPVRVLRDNGNASWGSLISGIVYAADIHADVINMSLGALLSRHGAVYDPSTGEFVESLSAQEVAEITVAFTRAVFYAYQNGVTVVAALHNAGLDLDHAADLFVLPAQLPHVIAVAAVGPQGWGRDPGTDPDRRAIYTNYGRSAVDFAAPGGNFDLDLLADLDVVCTGVVTHSCVLFDLVFSTMAGGGWFWNAGTSMATPHVSGVAALVIGQHGGSMAPSAVEAALRRGADDLGQPGRDATYGLGRVNALRSVDPSGTGPATEIPGTLVQFRHNRGG